MLSSPNEADDAVQEAWIRFSRSDTSAVADPHSWLTKVVSRICLNMLQTRRSRPEVSLNLEGVDAPASDDSFGDLEAEASSPTPLAPLLVILETLTPAERVAFVLHDTFVFTRGLAMGGDGGSFSVDSAVSHGTVAWRTASSISANDYNLAHH